MQQVLALGIHVWRLEVDNGSVYTFPWKQYGGSPDKTCKCIKSSGWKNTLVCDFNVQAYLFEKNKTKKNPMCSEFQIGTPVTTVASPIHFLLTKLGGMSWANHRWSPGSWMLKDWSQDTSCVGGRGMSYCPSQTNRKTDDLFIRSLTAWICSSVNCLFKPFPLGWSFCFQFAKLLFVYYIYMCVYTFYLSHGLKTYFPT